MKCLNNFVHISISYFMNIEEDILNSSASYKKMRKTVVNQPVSAFLAVLVIKGASTLDNKEIVIFIVQSAHYYIQSLII